MGCFTEKMKGVWVSIKTLILAEEMARWVKCLPYSHEALSLIPRTHVRSQVWWYVLVTPPLEEVAATGGPQGSLDRQFNLVTEF